MVWYIYTFFLVFSFSKVIINIKSFEIYVEQNLFFVHYLLNEKQKAYICTFVFRNVLKENGFIYEINCLTKVFTFVPSIFITGVHPPSPHPKFPMWQKTDNGWESTRKVTTLLTLDLLNQNKTTKTTNEIDNDGEIKLELIK